MYDGMFTPKFIRVFYWITMALFVILGLTVFLGVGRIPGFGPASGVVIIILLAIGLMLQRIFFELLMLVFRIADATDEFKVLEREVRENLFSINQALVWQDWLTFRRMLTPVFIKIMYFLFIVILGVSLLAWYARGLGSLPSISEVIVIGIFAPLVVAAVAFIVATVIAEILIVIFEINENITEIRNLNLIEDASNSVSQLAPSKISDFFHFRGMLTPILVQVAFWISIVSIILSMGLYIVRATELISLEMLLMILYTIMGVLVARVLTELVLVPFRINNSLTDIRGSYIQRFGPMSMKSVTSLRDFLSFRRMIFPTLLKIVFYVGLAVLGLGSLAFLVFPTFVPIEWASDIAWLRLESIGSGSVIAFLMAFLVFVLLALYFRIFIEILVVLFVIYGSLEDMSKLVSDRIRSLPELNMGQILTFRQMVTPRLVSIAFWALIAVVLIASVSTFSNDPLLGLILLLLLPPGIRLYAEIIIVTFRIYESFTEIVEALKRRKSGG